MIPLSRTHLLLVSLGVAASTFVMGLMSVPSSPHPGRVAVALALFAGCVVATTVAIVVDRAPTLSPVVSGLNAGVAFAMALLCAGGSAAPHEPGVADWYVGAAGCLLVLTMVRRQAAHAWIGAGLVVAHTILWGGFGAFFHIGVATMLLWVAAAYFGMRSLAHAMRDIRQFGRAEREAVEWQAAQDAHHFERQVRLTQTSRVALPMLRHIADVDCELDEAARRECRVLEQTIRDEIRGRSLLNDAVREQVIAHRRRGAFVQVLDDGGLDDIDPILMEPVLDEVAEAIAGLHSDRIIIRTAPKGSDKAVTVVGITEDPVAAALGLDDDGDEVDLWLEVPRPVGAPA